MVISGNSRGLACTPGAKFTFLGPSVQREISWLISAPDYAET
jgi:hypothetical protein